MLKCAIFDFDWTLVKPKSNSQFPRNADDWMWLLPSVPDVLCEYARNGYQIVIVSDQTKEWKIDMINDVINYLNLLIIPVISTHKITHKPSTDLFDFMAGDIDRNNSFMVGDAGFSPTDWSNADYRFAQNIGVKFYYPHEIFGTAHTDDLYERILPFADCFENNVVIMVGYPGSGKTTVCKQMRGYEIISGDSFKTHAKLLARAKQFIGGAPVIIDATNVTVAKRKDFVNIAKENGCDVTCVWLTTSFEESMARAKQRETETGVHIPSLAFFKLRKVFEPPSESEGFELILI